jgi:head-tail adaptor
MASRLHLKDKKIAIYQATSTQDQYGSWHNTYSNLFGSGARIWAYVRQASGNLVFRDGLTYNDEGIEFWVNWTDKLKNNSPQCYIVYQGMVYKVNNIDTYEGYKRDLRITAEYTTTIAVTQFTD